MKMKWAMRRKVSRAVIVWLVRRMERWEAARVEYVPKVRSGDGEDNGFAMVRKISRKCNR